MDSMRNLSTSLPNSGRRRLEQPELLHDFKAAALSVTNLYKSAVAVSARARAVGYQDALDDLLAFLDHENLGLMDGEGWRVRQWATERLDDGGQRHGSGSDDEVEAEAAKEEEPAAVERRSSSPEVQRKRTPTPRAEESSPQRRIVSEPAVRPRLAEITSSSPMPVEAIPTQNFTFRATHPYPSNHDREGSMDVDSNKDTASVTTTGSSTPSSTNAVRVASSRSARRHNRHHRERGGDGSNRGAATINLNVGGAGSKRRIPYPDFFDISGVEFGGQNHDRRDGRGGRDGGGKRSRHV